MKGQTEVDTSNGRVRGVRADGVSRFWGIPYAAPPAGDLRFRPPRRPEPWSGVLDATAPGPSAAQVAAPGAYRELAQPPTPAGVDCLNLNVWTPDPGRSSLPVLVWIHGGSFQTGCGADALHDGSAFARDGVVVVTFNYRLGIEGFLYLDGVVGGGNFGLLDQIAALEWVREGIAAFGGNPDDVTVGGTSAGALSIAALLAAPSAKGLFRRASLQSGAASAGARVDAATRVGDYLLRELGVDRGPGAVEQLRELPVSRLLDAEAEAMAAMQRQEPELMPEAPGMPLLLQPVVGTEVLPEPLLDAVAAGSAAGVDLLVGTNLEECRPFFALAGEALGLEDGADIDAGMLAAMAAAAFGGPSDATDELISVYRSKRGPANLDALIAIYTDWWFRIPAIRLAEAQREHAAVWSYLLTWRSDAHDGGFGAGHGLEMPLVFDSVHHEKARWLVGSGPPRALVDAMHGAVVDFVGGRLPERRDWPRYEEARATMVFDRTSAVVLDPDAETREVWDGLG